MKYVERYDYKYQLWINDDIKLIIGLSIVEKDLYFVQNAIYVGAFHDKNNKVSYGLKESGKL